MMPCANYNFALRPIKLADIAKHCSYFHGNKWLAKISIGDTTRPRATQPITLLGRHTVPLELQDAGSSTHSFSILRSAMKMGCRTHTYSPNASCQQLLVHIPVCFIY